MSVDETMKVVELLRAGLISTDDARRLLGFVEKVSPPPHTNFLGESYIPAWPADWHFTVDTLSTTIVANPIPNISNSPAPVAFATWKENFWENVWDYHKPPKSDPEPEILPLHAKRKITLEK